MSPKSGDVPEPVGHGSSCCCDGGWCARVFAKRTRPPSHRLGCLAAAMRHMIHRLEHALARLARWFHHMAWPTVDRCSRPIFKLSPSARPLDAGATDRDIFAMWRLWVATDRRTKTETTGSRSHLSRLNAISLADSSSIPRSLLALIVRSFWASRNL